MRTLRDMLLAVWVAVAVWACAIVPVASAATSLSSLYFAPDITVMLNGKRISPQQIAIDDLAGTLNILDVGTFPEGTHIVAYHFLSNGDHLLAFDTSIDLGGVTARPGDVVRFNGASYSLFFDATASGVPESAMVDAIALGSQGELLLSFDITVQLGAVTAEDEDLVRFQNDTFSLAFDGSAAGIPAELDLDGAYYVQGNGHLLLSFDGSGTVGNPAVAFDDEDVLEYDPSADSWERVYDGSAQASGWPPADLVALFAFPIIPTATPTSTVPNATVTLTPGQSPTQLPPSTHTMTATPVATVTGTSSTATATASASVSPTAGGNCAGDCDGDGTVRIKELV